MTQNHQLKHTHSFMYSFKPIIKSLVVKKTLFFFITSSHFTAKSRFTMTHSETIVPLDVTMCPIHSVSDALQSGLGVNIGSNLIES